MMLLKFCILSPYACIGFETRWRYAGINYESPAYVRDAMWYVINTIYIRISAEIVLTLERYNFARCTTAFEATAAQ